VQSLPLFSAIDLTCSLLQRQIWRVFAAILWLASVLTREVGGGMTLA
jgi:hypothetical protein